jgi:hypothetical protein
MGKSADMTLTLRHKILIGIMAAILVGLGVYLTRDVWTPIPDNTTYRDKNFSFEYPRVYKAEEYNRGAVIVGSKQDDLFTPLVEVVRYESDRDVALPPTFDIYVERQAQALCGSDGPIESMSCSDVVSAPFTSAQGLVGQELSLTLNRKNLASGTTTTATFGPVYVFNTTQPIKAPTDTLRYRAIFVYPSFASVASASTSPALLTQVIDSLLLPEVGTTTSN